MENKELHLTAYKCILCGHITPTNYFTDEPLDHYCICGESLLNKAAFNIIHGIRTINTGGSNNGHN